MNNKMHPAMGELLASVIFHILENDPDPELQRLLTDVNPDKLGSYLAQRNQRKHAELLARGANPQAGPARKVLNDGRAISQGGAPRPSGHVPQLGSDTNRAVADLFRTRG